MARVCIITGKKPLTGHKVSHSNHKTKKRQMPNMRTKRVFNESTGQWVTMKLSTSGIRTLTKLGVAKALKKFT